MSEPTENKQDRRESVKLDEIMRLLFDMSKETLVNMLNGLFGEAFDPALVDITKENAKFVNEQLEIIEGDFFARIIEHKEIKPGAKPNLYHVEFQTAKDDSMGIRVFKYDFNKAAEHRLLSGNARISYMPKSLVIHIEAHDSIPDEYKEIIAFADGDIKEFKVPVLKYWKLSNEYLISNNLFPLLPLKIYLLRAELDKLTKNNDEQATQTAILKARDIAEQIAQESAELNKSGRLTGEDYKKVLAAIANLFVHLNNRYKGDESLNERVKTMIELDFSEEHLREIVTEELATKLFDILDIETIAERFTLTIDRVKELKEKYLKTVEEN